MRPTKPSSISWYDACVLTSEQTNQINKIHVHISAKLSWISIISTVNDILQLIWTVSCDYKNRLGDLSLSP